ncbi:MAG: two-component system response regulator [Alkalinema sp. CACIAM 70d]|nr:MAG: two-component system response regulator [Alkalinema sp. CACIAM 70d]
MLTIVRNLSILLVEDDEVDVMNVQRALKKNGLEVPLHRAANGLEALNMLRHDSKHLAHPGHLLILLDLNMPKMGGLEFLQELRRDPDLRHIPVVVLTTSKQESDRVAAYELNVAGYIVKPITFSSFVETMNVISQYWLLSEMP